MSFEESQALAQNATFKMRVRHAMVKAAVAVMAEDPATLNHAKRAAFSGAAIDEPERTSARMAMGVVTNPVISGASSDSDIEFTVNSLWNAYAGVA
jgi:hypothetical protein